MVETRLLDGEIRANPTESRDIEGMAIVFNSDSKNLGGFIERIEPSAVEGVLEGADVLALLNHNVDRGVLARSKRMKGSLKLEVTDSGLQYRFKAPKTALGDEILEGIERGDITTSSFAFRVADGGEKWEKRDDGTYLRTITKFQDIKDVSLVYNEAYPQTSVAKRGLEELIEAEQEALRAAQELDAERAKQELIEAEKRELEEYFNNQELKLID
jgi:HK97 family phage prohead protease